jgi:phosphoribosylaminoimidazole-succinocarboxamide synthase
LHASGKVRDVYKLDSDHLLFVATDRISAFDYVLATGIPAQGPGTDPDFAVLVRLP